MPKPMGSVPQMPMLAATPDPPPAGSVLLYFKDDGKLYKLTSADVESEIAGGSGGGVTLDTAQEISGYKTFLPGIYVGGVGASDPYIQIDGDDIYSGTAPATSGITSQGLTIQNTPTYWDGAESLAGASVQLGTRGDANGSELYVNQPFAVTISTRLQGRFAGATASGAPAGSDYARVGDFIVARDGHIFVCTVAGVPGTWVRAGTGAFQPLDSDLTSIAALTTTSYGRAFLSLADQAALVALLPSYQPLDSDLTSIAALTTTSYGRDFLTLANQAALMTLVQASSETAQGKIEIATQTETDTGTDDARAITPLKFQTRLAAYAQPLDSDLTAIAALTTTSYGRALLELANQAALMGLISSASETAEGKIELATQAETNAGTDDLRAITPLKFQTRLAAYAQPLDSDLTSIAALATTSYGRAFLTLADQAALIALLPAYALDNAVVKLTGDQTVAGVKTFSSTPVVPDSSFGVAKLSATGTKDGTKFLRDDNTWQVPASGGGAAVQTGAPTSPSTGALWMDTDEDPAVPTNLVTTDTEQTVTAQKTFTELIQADAGISTTAMVATTATSDVLSVEGLTGAGQLTRYVGGTTSGAPASGTFAVGDFVIAQNGKVWICTTAGSPGTWTDAGGGGGGGDMTTNTTQSVTGVKTFADGALLMTSALAAGVEPYSDANPPETLVHTETTAPSTPSSGFGVTFARSSDSLLYFKNDAGTEYLLAHSVEPHTFAITGALTVQTGKSRVYLEGNYVVETIRASVNTAPTGASIIVDVNKNGTTIYTTQSARPTIAISGFTATGNSPAVTTFAAGDYITVDVDQIGSTIAGSDLTVTIRLRKVA